MYSECQTCGLTYDNTLSVRVNYLHISAGERLTIDGQDFEALHVQAIQDTDGLWHDIALTRSLPTHGV